MKDRYFILFNILTELKKDGYPVNKGTVIKLNRYLFNEDRLSTDLVQCLIKTFC